ncbi:Plasmid maintenance system killer protein [Legionella beliardensis]|uniref:Plasmid maintenance system killer protein n=1 Tax=Legionella beliardensis TaxID=91822 RepID=A0A378JU61_9GAMM|nr:type II toxin-antitoxin system mRNA interferase toxin, RelE/StbE family [Legionella beliardensis]STX55795.1 Plasmid maintenance system killer protein [Legionella beliardensis]STX55800.1 Plasmid maintenance system killer protein [Legionella beliardensis]
MITDVLITKQALKDLKRAPKHLQEKFRAWLVAINKIGLTETRKSPGWHDEPLKGDRAGQRSIRLNKQWRAIYILKKDGTIEFIEVMEVTPHDY